MWWKDGCAEKKRQVDGQVCFLESKRAGLFVSLHVGSGKLSCMTICSGDSFLAALKKRALNAPFMYKSHKQKKQVLWGSQKFTYICSKQKHLSWNFCLKRLVSHIKSISLKVPFTWCHLIQRDAFRGFFYQTAQHQFARASLIFVHDPTWRESSIKQFGLPNGKRL